MSDQDSLRWDVFVKVRRDFEQLREVGILLIQQVVQHPIAEQNDFCVQGDRLRLEADGADQAERLSERLHSNVTRLERANEPLPGIRLEQHLQGLDDEIAAVAAVQRAGTNQRKISHQCSQVGLMLDSPDQIVVRRVVFKDDRRAFRLPIIDQQIDFVFLQFVTFVGFQSQSRQRVLLFGRMDRSVFSITSRSTSSR